MTKPKHLPECPCPTDDDDPWYCCAECNPGVTPPWERVCICDRLRACEQRVRGERLASTIFHSPDTGPQVFALVRTTDVSGVSGTGTVAYGAEFPDGAVALRWVGGNPTSVVFHDNGMASVEAIHGHGGATQVMWLSEDLGPRAAEMDECEARGYAAALSAAREAVEAVDPPSEAYDDWHPKGKRLALSAIDALRGSGNPDTSPSAENEAIDALREDK